MKKTANFKVGDKVFAKVKGYPPWPAHVIAENGKKYNVEFYGTGETGVIKVEDLFYYLRNKDKFQKPLKRKDYVDAFEQIEEAIKEDGGDGDTSVDGDNSTNSVNNVSSNSSVNSLNSSQKGTKKSVKRKRSVSDKSVADAGSPKKKSQKPEEDKSESESIEQSKSEQPKTSISKSSPKVVHEPVSKEIEFVPINDSLENVSEETETNEKQNDNEKSEMLDFKIEIVSEKSLKNNIAYANYVKEKESIYKGKPVEPREDYISQVLPVKLPSGIMGGLKLHTEWPLKFEFEYDRALYDESVASRILEEKQKIEAGNTSVTTNHQLFIPNIEMSADDVTEILYQKDIEAKKSRIDRLKIESELMCFDSKIKNCLGLDKADPQQAICYLESIYNTSFDDLMLIKHPHVVEMVRRLRKYVGNTKEWNLSEKSLSEFSAHAEKVRAKAEQVYSKFKTVVKVPESSTSFWEGFTDLVSQFRTDCKDLTEGQIYLLCSEPTSRKTFLNNLEEIESEKENSSGVANSEHEAVKGGGETPAAES
ncbi:PC4 and SFRS1-interacting protein isoform X2 [Anoplophora glabripennis]|uniref:PC4 and SFRS1-interacting protein isoform X2 n=1 Tax=Anoplophora glabripennis TaxID=217634 RepID=UPI000875635E|nr:PC4 and SFRS1-interacting protein isoform X2 [Anoplophora glabripennis]